MMPFQSFSGFVSLLWGFDSGDSGIVDPSVCDTEKSAVQHMRNTNGERDE
jgi:hypothetical protein